MTLAQATAYQKNEGGAIAAVFSLTCIIPFAGGLDCSAESNALHIFLDGKSSVI
jgi:hypothetical protein